MEEEKAAAYYDDIVRKGGGAARFKQGLGYGAGSSPDAAPSKGSQNLAFVSFVKGDNHADSVAAMEREDRIASVRDKLNKRCDVDDSNHGPREHHRSRSRDRANDRREHEQRYRHRHGRSRSRSRDHRDSSSDDSYQTRRRRGRRGRSRSRSISPRKRSRDDRRSGRRSSRQSRSASRSPRSSAQHCKSRREPNTGESQSADQKYKGSEGKGPERAKPLSKEKPKLKKPATCDYSKLIPGFDDMAPAERVKAKMKLQLSETVSKDTAKGMSKEWERFDFNKEAPLDDETKLDYFGDGTGSRDDTSFLQNTGSTFLSSNYQARREAQIRDAHDAAIFGPPTGLSRADELNAPENHHSNTLTDEIGKASDSRLPPAPNKNLVSSQVLAMQQGSWRERALKLKGQRAANAAD